MNKPKIGILKFLYDGREFPVIIEDWQTYRLSIGGEVHAVMGGETLTPYDEWEPPVEDGVWWCEHKGGSHGILVIKDGKHYWDTGVATPNWAWKQIRRLSDIPEEWKERV